MRPLVGTDRCWTHSTNPQVAARRNAGLSRGGRARKHQPKAKTPVDVSTLAALQDVLGQVMADTLLLPNSPRRSQAVARLLHEGAALVELSQLATRLERIEAVLRGVKVP
jgi:hypothetical protein